MQDITRRIQEEARRLFEDGKVDVVIGYQQGWDDEDATPCFVTEGSQVDELVFDGRCFHNLAKFLVGREGYLTSRFTAQDERPRVAVVATPVTLRTIAALIQERQFKRSDLIILGVVDGGDAGVKPDVEVGQIEADTAEEERISARLAEFEEMSASELWAFWEEQFSKCIRCYACRQVCPFCYCERCITDENQPRWIGRSPSPENNRSWNIIRALHLVGRCTECGECDRVCPVEIPLSVLAAKMVGEVREAFDYEAGRDIDAVPALASFRVDDPNDFIR